MVTRQDPRWTYAELSASLGLSASEANGAVDRATRAGLLGPPLDPDEKPRPVATSLVEFIEHGVRYAFFARPGQIVRGWPTAHSAPPLDGLLQEGEEPSYVWPDAEGTERGQAIEPLYPTVPRAARKNSARSSTSCSWSVAVAAGLLVTDPGASPIRPTLDVALLVEARSYAAYHRFSERLRARGFSQGIQPGDPLCR